MGAMSHKFEKRLKSYKLTPPDLLTLTYNNNAIYLS